MSMPTVLAFPADGAVNPVTVTGSDGRPVTYSTTPGVGILVPFEHAMQMTDGKAWTGTFVNGRFLGAGTTANRPVAEFIGQRYHDTTLGQLIIWGGPVSQWRSISGAGPV